jgi:hypothetical protein
MGSWSSKSHYHDLTCDKNELYETVETWRMFVLGLIQYNNNNNNNNNKSPARSIKVREGHLASGYSLFCTSPRSIYRDIDRPS